MDQKLMAFKKAQLLAGGPVSVPDNFTPPFPLSRSTAGPGAGSASMVLEFGGLRIKKTIVTGNGDFYLRRSYDGTYTLMKDGEVFLENVSIGQTLAHAPEQAFFNLETECIYSCRFCTSPALKGRGAAKSLSDEQIIASIKKHSESGKLKSAALTSAVVSTPQETIDRMCRILRAVKSELPDLPLGVEPYVDSESQILQLKEAGAEEIKLNIETYDKDIFEKVCGEQDLDKILSNISVAVEVFGRGKVASNLIYGMGETDENVLAGCKYLASLGCVATLRPLRLNDINRPRMEEVFGPIQPVKAERMIRLTEEYKKILEKYGLTTKSFRTMCHECTCCDIVPMRDI